MSKNQKSEALFTDCLCYESFFSVGLFKSFKSDWYFISESKIFSPFRRLLEKLISVNFISLDYISYPDEYLGETSLFESINEETKTMIKSYLASEAVYEEIQSFSKNHSLNINKINQFLTFHYHPYIYRLNEIKLLIRHLKIDKSRILLISSPISDFIKTEEDLILSNYMMLFSNYFQIKKRKNYHHDVSHGMKPYFKQKRALFFTEILRKLLLSSYFISSKVPLNRTLKDKCLGIELVQRRLNISGTNDLFFTHNNEINDPDCCLIEEQIYTSHYDSSSYESIRSRDFRRLKIFNLKTIIKQQRIGEIDQNYKTNSLLKIIGTLSFTKNISQYIKYLIVFSVNKSFLSFLLKQYAFDNYIWSRIYKEFNISIVWSMLDGSSQQVSRSQAIELNDGVYTGSHWSNYPIIKVGQFKPQDILFVWSQHFKELFERDIILNESHIVGYISTDYFHFYKEESASLKKEYPEKFIITFNDNVFYNDIAISESHYDEFYLLASEILEQNEDVIIFIKPKRQELFNRKINSFHKLNDFIKKGRARLFLSDNPRSKITPAQLALASDLVIGLGNSTTTLESIIAKTPSLNLDFCKFPNNKFSKTGLDQVVFNDRSKIFREVQNQLKKSRRLSLNDHKEYYQILDPFLDEKSGERIAKKLMNLLNRMSNLDKLQS